jgi:hypothetical protein
MYVLRNSLAGSETDLYAEVDYIVREQAVSSVVKLQVL